MHDSIGEVVLERHGYPRIPKKRWSALVSLVDRTYLSCLCIVQEVALSMGVELWCGNLVLEYSTISYAPYVLASNNSLSGVRDLVASSDHSPLNSEVGYHCPALSTVGSMDMHTFNNEKGKVRFATAQLFDDQP